MAKKIFMVSILLIMVLSLIKSPTSQATTTISDLNLSQQTIAVGSDYTFEERGYFWDFSDPYHYNSVGTRSSFYGGGSLVNGWFVGTVNTADPRIWLQEPNIPGTVPTQNEGAYHPIDTSKYRYLTFRVCSSKTTSAFIFWHQNAATIPGSYGVAGPRQINVGCGIYTYDLVSEYNSLLPWNAGPIQTIAIRITTEKDISIEFDYARLSATPNMGPPVTISWTPIEGSVDLYLNNSPASDHLTPIAKGLNGSDGSYNWTVPPLAPGNYYIIAENNNQQTISPVFHVNRPPDVTINAPSYTSGPDYATTVVGNPWDMSDPADVVKATNVTNTVLSNSIFVGTNTNDDPQVLLNVTTPIDPSRFYYATYRMKLEGPQSIEFGSVARLFWWTSSNIPASYSVTKDIVVYEGWRSVTADLRTVLLEQESHGSWQPNTKVGFRLDPIEFPDAHTFLIDDVKLTGNSQANASFGIRNEVRDENGDPLTTQFYYTTNQSGANSLPITCMSSQSIPTNGDYTVYLPMVLGSSIGNCLWDTSSIPNGDYYIVMKVNDGFDTTTRISEAPLEVRH